MDIGGINRAKPLGANAPSASALDLKRNAQSNADRDAQGHAGYQKQTRPNALTEEQEQEAVTKLNESPAFQRVGLKAVLVRETGKPTHVVVRDAQNAVVRHMPYEQVVDLYLNRHMEKDRGTLLRRAA